jgi:hypothetical protein
LPELPDVKSLAPQMMTAAELQAHLVTLFDWLQAVEAAPGRFGFTQATVDEVRDAINLVLEERRDRHADEGGFRGG